MKSFALRLRPHQDLRGELEAFARSRDLHAAFILTCVGSLRHAALPDHRPEVQQMGVVGMAHGLARKWFGKIGLSITNNRFSRTESVR